MNINYKPAQIELFPSNPAELNEFSKPRIFFANLTLSIESLVILSILGIMVTVFSFAIGVEHGKRQVAQALDERVAQAWNVGARRIQAPAAAVVAVQKPVVKQQAIPVGRNVISTKPVLAKTTVSAKALPVVKTIPAVERLTAQLSSYRSETYARDEALKLRGKGIKTFLVKSGDFWLVCAGQFKSKEEAAGFINKLPSKFRQAQVRRF